MASLQKAVQWIALNDNSGQNDSVDDVAGYISVVLVADIFSKDPMEVARKVVWWRRKYFPTIALFSEAK